ncbi:MAG TPA: hypothetical protein VF792_12525 [Ktedonobacterales bacterium]
MNGSNGATRRRDKLSSGLVSVLVALPIVFVAIVIGMYYVHAAQANGTPPGPMKITNRPVHRLGIPAIQPRAAAMANGARFTSADVRSYIAAHPKILEGAPGKPTPTVTSVQFMSAGQASAMMQGESIGLPDASPVCVVTVQGTFSLTWGPRSTNGATSETVSTHILVFDVQTGNLLIG